jgi:hypothetical protein
MLTVSHVTRLPRSTTRRRYTTRLVLMNFHQNKSRRNAFATSLVFPASAAWWTVAGAMDWVAIAPEDQRMRLALALARAATHKLRSRSPRSAPRSPRSAPSSPSSPKARLGLSPRERATLHAFAPMSPRIKGCPAEEVCAHAYEPSGPSSALSHSSSLTATDASLCFSMLPRRSASKTACST